MNTNFLISTLCIASLSTITGCSISSDVELSAPILVYSNAKGPRGIEIFKRADGSCYQVDSGLIGFKAVDAELGLPIVGSSKHDVTCPVL